MVRLVNSEHLDHLVAETRAAGYDSVKLSGNRAREVADDHKEHDRLEPIDDKLQPPPCQIDHVGWAVSIAPHSTDDAKFTANRPRRCKPDAPSS